MIPAPLASTLGAVGARSERGRVRGAPLEGEAAEGRDRVAAV